MTLAPALALAGITRRFGSVVALDGADFTVRAGTVHALLGENGAGKTTLMRVAFGLTLADTGTVAVNGEPRTISTPADALAHGLGMVQQHFALVPAMTVAENIALGGHGRFNPSEAAAVVHGIGARTGLLLDADQRVGDLSVGAQQRCEIVKALAHNARVLILDEPTAVLAPAEAAELLAWLRRFVTESPEHAVVLITHKLRDALAVADDVTVLRRGRVVATGTAQEFTADSLAVAMLGDAADIVASGSQASARELSGESTAHFGRATAPRKAQPRTDDAPGGHPDVMRATKISLENAQGVTTVRRATFVVHAGEIVGLAAIEGSGQRELLRALAGLLAPSAGRLDVPADVGFVPEDRHQDALLLDASLTENVLLRDAGQRRGRIAWRQWRARTAALLTRRDVRAPGPDTIMRTLSGGNQQKLVLARALEDTPTALVVENPTRGLDFRATVQVHRALRDARDAGIAVVLYSSDLDEVLALSDRVLALHAGELTEVPRDRDVVGRAILGAS